MLQNLTEILHENKDFRTAYAAEHEESAATLAEAVLG